MTDAIILEGVRRSFGRAEVLKGVTAKARPGQVVGLLGRNGEGKTTILRILLDLLAAESGSVSVLGRSPDGSGELRQLIGYVPEQPAFHDFMTAGEVLAWRERFFRRFSMERAREAAKRMDLDLATPVRGASKGTLGKLAWACASAHDPDLYLLDEPTSGLDALVRDEVLSHLISDLQERGRTVLVANHHMEELAAVLDEVWLLAGGRIAGVYDAEVLRTQARLIRGRLKDGKGFPAGLAGVPVEASCPVVSWACFDAAGARAVGESGCLEGLESVPMSMDQTLRLLLKEDREVRHDGIRAA